MAALARFPFRDENNRRQQPFYLEHSHLHHQSLISSDCSSLSSPSDSNSFDQSCADNFQQVRSLESRLSQSTSDLYLMPTTPQYNPPIRIQHSIPSPGGLQASNLASTFEDGVPQQSWYLPSSNDHLRFSTGAQRFHLQHRRSSHKRNSSESTVGSVGPASPHTPTLSHPRIVDSDSLSYPSPGFDAFETGQFAGTSYPKSLSNSSQPSYPVVPFLTSTFQDFHSSPYNAEELIATQNAMTQVMMAQQDSKMGGDSTSAPRSSYGGDEYDENLKGSIESRNIIPKLDRTMSDIYQDELYNPNVSVSASARTPQSCSSQNAMLSPFHSVFSERLQAANNRHISARSESPAHTVTRERSPFRQGHEHSAEQYLSPNQPGARLSSASQMREKLNAQSDAVAFDHQTDQQDDRLTSLKTISPKEVALDYEPKEDSRMPLFPQDRSKSRVINDSTQPSASKTVKPDSSQGEVDEFEIEKNYDDLATTRCQSSSEYSSGSGQSQSRSSFPFAPPAVPGNVQVPQQYPFIAQLRGQSSGVRSISEQVPEFPAHLTSMETTKSDSGIKSENGHSETSPEIQRPTNTMADTGTYTCTYHGCTMRFGTPQKLQKHKREAHRSSTPHTNVQNPTSTSGNQSDGNSSSTATSIANRNSQAGPHKCDRINPSTGKPCNSIFSRPYDLTRHEDTIHNARKQKVRCQFCTEEKTFSRNDALTRHMRVVHPDVDFPGKTKRKG